MTLTQGLLIENAEGPRPVSMLFDGTWRAVCKILPCSVSEVEAFIAAHYLKKRPAIVLLALKMLCGAEPVGCVIYSAPPVRRINGMGDGRGNLPGFTSWTPSPGMRKRGLSRRASGSFGRTGPKSNTFSVTPTRPPVMPGPSTKPGTGEVTARPTMSAKRPDATTWTSGQARNTGGLGICPPTQ